jgi:hypothetical protein
VSDQGPAGPKALPEPLHGGDVVLDMLEIVHTDNKIELSVEFESGDIACFEPAVRQSRPPGDLVGALDELRLEFDAEHLSLGMALGEFEREDSGAGAGVEHRSVVAVRSGEDVAKADAQAIGRRSEHPCIEALGTASTRVERDLATRKPSHGL